MPVRGRDQVLGGGHGIFCPRARAERLQVEKNLVPERRSVARSCRQSERRGRAGDPNDVLTHGVRCCGAPSLHEQDPRRALENSFVERR